MASKPIDSLTVQDIQLHPIWEFATDEEGVEGQDETWVRPFDSDVIPLGEYSLSVAADFRTKSGIQLEGIVSVSTAGEIATDAAALLLPGQYVFVPSKDYRNADKEYIDVAAILGETPNSVFPLQAILRVAVDGEESLRTCVFG